MTNQVSYKICLFIADEIRPKYTSNREMADVIGIDEKTIRRILSKDYSISVNMLKKICASEDLLLSDLFLSIAE